MKTPLARRHLAAVVALANLLTGTAAMALQQSQPATTTATAPAEEGAPVVTVTAVEGKARARTGPTASDSGITLRK